MRREPRVSCINSLKKSNLPKDLIFGLIQTVERNREGGRERKPSFSLRFKGFHRSELGSPRIKVDLRDEGYVWIPESPNSSKVQGYGFHGNQEKVMSREITPLEVGFFSYSG